jgi:hypothetical protein
VFGDTTRNAKNRDRETERERKERDTYRKKERKVMTARTCLNLSHDFLATPKRKCSISGIYTIPDQFMPHIYLAPTCRAGETTSAMGVRDQKKCGLATVTLR